MPGLGLGISPCFAGVGSLYDADAQLYFDQLTGSQSSTWKDAVNTLVVTLKADGNWTKLDRMWIHAAEVQQNARISLVNPTSTAITEVNSPTWTASQGYTGNGSSMYLDSNYTPSVNGVTYTLNSACFGVYCRNNTNGNYIDMANYTASPSARFSEILPRFTTNVFYAGINGGADITAASADSRGFWSHRRTAANAVALFRNGSSIGTGTTASVGLVTNDFFILARNLDGVADSHSNHQLALSFIGGGDLDQTTLYSAIQTFATTIGFNV